MLVLSRKVGERIVVSDCGLAITVLAVEGNTIRLGICAPAEIAVYREEIWREICRQSPSPPAGE
jgi:carbon storage regulator